MATASKLLKLAAGFVGAAALTVALPVSAQLPPRIDSTTSPDSQPSTPRSTTGDPLVRPYQQLSNLDREFMLMAAHSDNTEILTSQLALERSESPEVRQYAQMMIEQHTQSSERLQRLASSRGIVLPSDVGPLNSAVYEQLSQLSGPEFDRAYMGTQTNSHMMAVALYRTQIEQGQDGELQAFATDLLPLIAEHYEMANQMTDNYRARLQ